MNTAFRSEQFLSITAILMSAFSTTFYLEFGRKHRGLNEEMVQIVLIFILQILFFLLISKRHFRVAQSDVKNVAMICLPSLCLVGFGDIKAIGMILVILGCFAISNTLSIKAVSRTITCLVLINIFAQLYSTIFSATEIFGIEMSTKLQ